MTMTLAQTLELALHEPYALSLHGARDDAERSIARRFGESGVELSKIVAVDFLGVKAERLPLLH